MPDTFREAVYALARKVPAGKVVTYGQLAIMLERPRAARAVGGVMRGRPGDVPAHRVIKADGSLCQGHLFGMAQRRLLLEEGVPFLADGRVDLRACRWDGAGQ